MMQLQSNVAFGKFSAQSGTVYTSDANGLITVASNDINSLLNAGCVPFSGPLTSNFRNIFDGPDFSVNPFQRNIPGLASAGVITTAISNTPTYFADRWFGVGGASSAILFSLLADTSIPGFSQSLKLSRQAANTNTAAINIGQVIETLDAVKLQGQTVTLSFWAKTGVNYSGGSLGVQLISGTGTNQTAAQMVAASWTGQTSVINTTQALTGSMVRYQFTAAVPAACTQIGALFSFTPSGTAGADDSISFQGFQLEIGAQAGPFEHRDVQVELEICQRYAWLIAEPAANVIVGIGGAVAAANAQVFYLAAPVQFVKAPTVSVNAGAWKVSAAAAAAAATGLAAGATHTVNAISITSAVTETVGLAASLQGGGGTGWILASADF